MFGTRQAALAVLLMCLAARAWCQEPQPPGTVFVVGGIGGIDPLQSAAPRALPAAGVPHRILVFHWTHGKMHTLKDLQDTPYLLQRASEPAGLVAQTLAREPGRPVYLVGQSAGAALVLAAAEKLPPCSLERIILLSAAMSACFNLCPALRATRKEIVSFHSCRDVFWLGLFTRVVGNSDRTHCCAAGKEGFTPPPSSDQEACRLYQRLVQSSFCGGHEGGCRSGFLARMAAISCCTRERHVEVEGVELTNNAS
jgi:pimeloyl-ACP methyl ester carboxylesterase